jgi:hypothetical protein
MTYTQSAALDFVHRPEFGLISTSVPACGASKPRMRLAPQGRPKDCRPLGQSVHGGKVKEWSEQS